MSPFKKISAALLVCVIVALAFLWAARTGVLTPDDETLIARYGAANSRFIDVDGQRVHYRDEGSGPAVVLVHGSFGSLRMWDSWVPALTDRYRVVRFDRPPMGLSSPQPGGSADVAQDEMAIIDRLTRELGIERFFLVGTSSAGLSVAAYAAEHPERVTGVILSNVAIGAMKPVRGAMPWSLKLALAIDPWLGGWHPQLRWRGVLQLNFFDPRKVTPALVREWTDLNNRAQRLPRPRFVPSGAMFARTATDLPRIRVPTLLLWSANDHEFPVETTARGALAALTATDDKSLVIIDRCGHMMPLECGAESVRAARSFFDRESASP